MQSGRRDIFAQVVGFFVMLLGIAVILGVLWLGFQMFRDPNLGLGGAKNAPTATDLGVGFVRLILRLALLFLGSISGSLIANKGIHLYFSGAPGGVGGTAHTVRIEGPSSSAEPARSHSEPTEKIAKRS
jgi:hypothetical protein